MQNMPDYAQLMRMAQSPQGQKLMELLQNTDNAALTSALSSARSGDWESARQALSAVLNSPEAQSLMDKFGR